MFRRISPRRLTFALIVLTALAHNAFADLPSAAGSGTAPNIGDRDPGASPAVRDPLEPVNRTIFAFNDKLYFWILRPMAQGYDTVMPAPAQTGVANFFRHLGTPIRLVNCTLQGRFSDALDEAARFAFNTTWGVAGFADPAAKHLNVPANRADTGQTLARYGLPAGIHIVWPVFGPSNVRDSIGMVGDRFLNPTTYLTDPEALPYLLTATNRVNHTALHLGEYEDWKESVSDPYAAMREAYSARRGIP